MLKWVSMGFVFIAFLGVCGLSFSDEQEKIMPMKVRVDSDFDGKIDRVEFYDNAGNIIRVESDTTGDGKTDKWVHYEKGRPVKSEKDTNADGKPDVWSEY